MRLLNLLLVLALSTSGVYGQIATVGSGIVIGSNLTLTGMTLSLSVTGAIAFPDGVRQTFNPNGTAAGVNVGGQAGDPSTPINGDLWYDSTANALEARINGATVALGGGGGSLSATDIDTSAELQTIVTDNTGASGALVFAGAPTITDVTLSESLNRPSVALGAGTSIDPTLGNWFTKTLTADTTFTFANLANGQVWNVDLIQDSTPRTVTWPTTTWRGGSTPVMDTGSGVINTFTFRRDGGVTYGDVVQQSDTQLDTIAALGDPGANRILMWDDTDNAYVNAVVGSGLTYTAATDTLSSAGGGLASTDIDTSAEIAGIVGDETGTGLLAFGTSPTLTTPTISGAIAFPDGTRQTFNPDGTASGLNVGAQAGDPGTPSNGDLWYDSTANELTARINGANVALGAGGSSLPAQVEWGSTLKSDGTNDFRDVPERSISYFTDFIGVATEHFTSTTSGAGASFTGAAVPDTNSVGVVFGNTGTTTTGYAGFTTLSTATPPSRGVYRFKVRIQLSALSDATESTVFVAGLHDANTTNAVDGIWFKADSNLNANWRCLTAKGGGTTSDQDSGVAIAATTWVNLEFVTLADWSSVAFYINGSLVATETSATSIPTLDRTTGINVRLYKYAGTTARTFTCDYIKYQYVLNFTR